MSTRLFFIAVVVVSVSAGLSPAQPPTAAQREAMKKLDFLVGQWKGEGWMEIVPGQRRTFKGTEAVQSKLDGLLLTIDGLHRGQVGGKGEEVVVQNAFALVSYDSKAKRYRFQGFTTRGNHEDTEAKVTDGQLVWGLKIPQFGDVRYTIKLDDKGRWFEVGEVSQDGKEWRKFFEMTLERVAMNEDVVLMAARKCAEGKGYKLEDYTAEKSAAEGGDEEHRVVFQGKEKRPGNHFTVYVHKKTNECRLVPGR